MKTENEGVKLAEEVIISKIYNVRGKPVMIAQDLAELYQVDTINYIREFKSAKD